MTAAKNKGKFDDIFSARAAEDPEANNTVGGDKRDSNEQQDNMPAEAIPAAAANYASPLKRGPGRPPGKRSKATQDGTYTQVTAYIPKTTHADVMKKLTLAKYDALSSGVNSGKVPDFSELVNELLTEWLAKE